MLRSLLSSVFCLIIFSNSWGQSNIDNETHFLEASHIVEAKIISSNSFYQEGNIFTSYKLEIYNQFKGDNNYGELEFIKVGGAMENEGLTVFPSINIRVNDVGLFLLKQTDIFGANKYRLLTATNSYLPIDYAKNRIFGSMFNTGHMDLQELHRILPRITKHPKIKIKDNPYEFLVDSRNVKILSINQTSTCAGCNDLLTINGSGFLANKGDFGTVLFTNANMTVPSISVSGIVYNSWSDSKIELSIPYDAGSGSVVVRNNNFEQSSPSLEQLDIEYNVMNTPKGAEIRLIDDESDGDYGYKFSFSDETANNGVDITSIPNAPDLVYESFNYYNENVPNFAIYLDESCPTSQIQVPANDNVNLISFDNDLWDLDMMVGDNSYGSVYIRWIKCGTSEPEVVDIDIFLRRDGDPNLVLGRVKWNFRDTLPRTNEMDFKSVVMHQLGHAMLLGHVQESHSLMFHTLDNGLAKRHLHKNDSLGATWVHSQSKAYNPPMVNCLYQFSQNRQYGDFDSTKTCGLILAVHSIELLVENIQNTYATVNFEVVGENNVKMYEIYRRSHQSNFEKLVAIPAENNDEEINNYQYEDFSIKSGTNTYMVRVINENGTIYNSEHVSVNIQKGQDVRILQNPLNRGQLRLDFPDDMRGERYNIYNLKGELITKGTLKNTIDMTNLPIGTFVLSLNNNSLHKAIKFTKID